MLFNPIACRSGLVKWAAYVLLLLAPGSFVLLPALWLLRQLLAWAATRRTSTRGTLRRVEATYSP